jgi:hypothetical protein
MDQEIEGSNPSSPANIPNVKRPRRESAGPLFGLYPTPYPDVVSATDGRISSLRSAER